MLPEFGRTERSAKPYWETIIIGSNPIHCSIFCIIVVEVANDVANVKAPVQFWYDAPLMAI